MQPSLFPQIPPLITQQSRYVRNTWILKAEHPLFLEDGCNIRIFSRNEATQLSEKIKSKNIFARMPYGDQFYVDRVKSLADKTIIEIYLPGERQEIREQAEYNADLLEKLTAISSTLVVRKSKYLRLIGVSSKPKEEVDFIIGSPSNHVSSNIQKVLDNSGVIIDSVFVNRFKRCGFETLYKTMISPSSFTRRIITTVDWLFESKREPSLRAAIVKTSIALESLLIFNESENLTKSLSDRVAFLLSSKPMIRQKLSKLVSEFYSARSAIVHGERRRNIPIYEALLDAIDRICILSLLAISNNLSLWNSEQQLQKWLEKERWGFSEIKVIYPFPQSYLSNALSLIVSKC